MSQKQKKNTPAENKEKRAISFAQLKKDKRFWIGVVIFADGAAGLSQATAAPQPGRDLRCDPV